AAHPLVLPADIKRIVEMLPVVSADVEDDRQCRRGMQSGAGGVERKLADRNAHAASALVAETENTFAVADDDGLDVVEAAIGEDAANIVLMRIAQKQASGLAENMAESLAAQADGRRINDRHHLLDVLGQQRVKQGFVGILQTSEKGVLLDVGAQRTKRVVATHNLIVEFGNVRWQQSVKFELVALLLGKGRAFVEQGIVQKLIAALRGLNRGQIFPLIVSLAGACGCRCL